MKTIAEQKDEILVEIRFAEEKIEEYKKSIASNKQKIRKLEKIEKELAEIFKPEETSNVVDFPQNAVV